MNWYLICPILWPMLAAVICREIGKRSKSARTVFTRCVGLSELAMVVVIALAAPADASLTIPRLCGSGLSLTLDGFRRIYAVVSAVLWAGTLCFSGEYFAHYHNRNRYYFFNLLTLGAAMGVFLSADLMTTFVFFEIMSFTSYVWVAHDETAPALRAAETYLGVAVIGGMVALMGLFLLWHTLGTLRIDALYAAASACPNRGTLYVASACLLFGFGAKAGMFPLHIWLPKAHPVAPAPASALLSGLLTKTGVFGALVICAQIMRGDHAWGTVILTLGTVTMVLGAVLALFSVDLKRTLACSSMSQIGFILVGAGALCLLGHENALAARGTLLHMVNHSLFKLVLFLCAGAVYMNLHQLNLNDIRGFGRKKPVLHFAFLMGALGIGGVPLWSGYISKTLLHESLVELGGAYKAVEILFLFSGGLTLAYMTKLYICLFWQKHPTRQKEFDAKGQGMCLRSAVTLIVCALAIPVLGMSGWMDRIADLGTPFLAAGEMEHAVHFFIWENLKGAVISAVIGAAVYLGVVRPLLMKKGTYLDRWPAKLDLEERVYRPFIALFKTVFGALCAVMGENRVSGFLCRWIVKIGSALVKALLTVPEKLFVRTAQAGSLAAHAVLDVPDAAVLGLGKTVLRQGPEKESNAYTRSGAWRLGNHIDRANAARGRSSSLGQKFYHAARTLRETTMRITGSLSFALLMACIGVCALMFYLLIHFA